MAGFSYNTLMVLGPTASGKTRLGARLAHALGGEILSADSRQVYRGLNIGSGKDLEEYVVDGAPLPYHLIDIVGLEEEFNVFAYQRAFYEAFAEVGGRGRLPVVVGGTGMYLDAVLRGYALVEAPGDSALRAELAGLSDEELDVRLAALKPAQHNTTDTQNRGRCIRAIEIAVAEQARPPAETPPVNALVLGARWEREELRARIGARLKARLAGGLIEEVKALHAGGCAWERLELLGLEYRFVAQYLQGEIKRQNDLFQKLNGAIARFAKRQETWFRRMERKGTEIAWVDRADADAALEKVRAVQWETR